MPEAKKEIMSLIDPQQKVKNDEMSFSFNSNEMKKALSSEMVKVPDEIMNFDQFEDWLENF